MSKIPDGFAGPRPNVQSAHARHTCERDDRHHIFRTAGLRPAFLTLRPRWKRATQHTRSKTAVAIFCFLFSIFRNVSLFQTASLPHSLKQHHSRRHRNVQRSHRPRRRN
jgi:hypothetical protein